MEPLMSENITPLAAIIGRPNVGKSTLFNRITGSRKAIVGDEPGITRDRNFAPAEWRGRHFRIVDTGGLELGEESTIPKQIFKQAKLALDEAAQVILVVDGRGEITGSDRDLAKMLLKLGKPLVLAVTKADSQTIQQSMQEWRRFGVKRMHFVSGETGIGVDDLLDDV